MYTTANAVRLVVRAATWTQGAPGAPCYCYSHDTATVAQLVDLGVLVHNVRDVRGLSVCNIEITDVGRVVFRELQRKFEELLHTAAKAQDEQLRLRRQRTLNLDRTHDR